MLIKGRDISVVVLSIPVCAFSLLLVFVSEEKCARGMHRAFASSILCGFHDFTGFSGYSGWAFGLSCCEKYLPVGRYCIAVFRTLLEQRVTFVTSHIECF